MISSEMIGPILVMGATGAQGGAVADALLRASRDVRILVRDENSKKAHALGVLGATVFVGDMDDRASLDRALHGAHGVFSVQLPPTGSDEDFERRTGQKLVDAAHRAGVIALPMKVSVNGWAVFAPQGA